MTRSKELHMLRLLFFTGKTGDVNGDVNVNVNKCKCK
jgi:hypothetical protein